MVPRVLLGAVTGVEVVAEGALNLTRDVLVSAVCGAASIGAEALTATVAGARGVVSAASRMVGDIAATAQGTFREALENARRARQGVPHGVLRRPPARMTGRSDDEASEAAAAEPVPVHEAVRRRHARSKPAA
jgi:hypothetical protein